MIMNDFIIEKDIPKPKKNSLPEYIKQLIEQLEPDESFQFPVNYYAAINSYKQRYSTKSHRKFTISYQENNKGRMWRKS